MTSADANREKKPASAKPAAPPDGGWGWMVTFGSFMIHVIADGITYSLGIFLVEFMQDFKVGSEATSWIASILVAVTLGSGPIVSWLVNKYGCRAVAITGAVVSSVGLGISVLATNVTTLYVTVGVVAGLGFGLMYLPAIVSVTMYFEAKRSFATGIAVCGSGVGTFVFAPLCEWLISSYHWTGALLILAGIGLNGAIFGALFRPIGPSQEAPSAEAVEMAAEMTEKEKLDQEEASRLDVAECDQSFKSECVAMMDLSLFKDPIFVLFSLSNFCTSIGFNVPYVFMKDKALDLDINSQDASFLIAVIGIANTVGRIIIGYVSDKPWLNRLFLYNIALTISGIATALSAYCVTYTTLVIYAAVFGATIGAYVGLTSVVLVDLLGLEKLTNAFGLVIMFQGIASLAGPPIAGRLKDTTNSYDPAFYVAGFMIAISGLMLFFIRHNKLVCSPRSKDGDTVGTPATVENAN